ncbi:MAG: gliding motility-associated ABC transporter substrate-binding protein GldG [Bacteroidales bacterium]|nr:gliding motility-associated ABC transporter substrate-binding protein GldG [Bacteroidales bacterium]
MKKRQVRTQNIIQLLLLLVVVVLINLISHFVNHRFDLTQEKRYTLAPTTKNFLKDLDDVIYVKIYLEGNNLPAGFRSLQKATAELMDEFRVYSGTNLEFEFINPSESPDPTTRDEIYQQLAGDGMMYFNVTVDLDNGSTANIPVFPSAMISYRTHGQQFDRPVNFFQGSSSNKINDETINRAIESLEYEFISAMRVISREMVPRVAMITGHDELTELESNSLFIALSSFYRVEYINIENQLNALDEFNAIIVADPKSSFSEQDKFIIDQFIMRGGKVLWMVDAVKVDMNVLADTNEVMSSSNGISLGDMLFDYGVKVNSTLIQDIQCAALPVNSASEGQAPQWQPVPFFYFPLISPNQENPITRNLNMIKMEFVSPLDTVGEDPEIKKTVLLSSSNHTRIRRQPVRVSFDDVNERPDLSRFPMRHLPVAVLLEGRFNSFYQNRLAEQWTENEFYEVLDSSQTPTKMIVIGDGDVGRNYVSYQTGQPRPQMLGYDRFYKYLYSNKDFLLNCMNYLLDDVGVMGVRSREVQLRLMQYEEITEKKLKWRLINLIVPVVLVLIFGIIYSIIRKKKYAKKIIN